MPIKKGVKKKKKMANWNERILEFCDKIKSNTKDIINFKDVWEINEQRFKDFLSNDIHVKLVDNLFTLFFENPEVHQFHVFHLMDDIISFVQDGVN